MSSRTAFWTVATFLALCVLVRAFPFVWWPAVHFDSDQAVVGLMAKHVSEGRAWPLYYYGQNYMLAVEAYLAAPLMWVVGPTVTALKTPLVAINIAIVTLLLHLAVRDAKLPPWIAAVAVLPLALPAAPIAARTTEANGGNVEPWLYVLLLWWLRRRPFAFGAVLGVGVLHREFTAYGAAGLLILDVLALIGSAARRTEAAATARHWALAAVTFFATQSAAAALQPFANGLGPGTRGDDLALVVATVDTLGGRICFEPASWGTRLSELAMDHLPRLAGGVGAPLRDYGVLTRVFSGQTGLGLWVGTLTAVGLGAGIWHWGSRRRAGTGDDLAHLAGYLVLVGLISTIVYGFATCSEIRVETLRYNLLALMIPVGALIMALQTWSHPAVRAGLSAAVGLWCVLNTLDVLALTRDYLNHPLSDDRQIVADALVARGVRVARAEFRSAYHVTFLAREQARLAAAGYSRIKAYAAEAAREHAPTLADAPCPGGDPLPNGQFLCPSPPP